MTIATAPATVPDLLGTSPADLIDAATDLPVATPDVAVRRAERIRARLFHYAEMRQDIADAYAQRDWRALDYDSWHSYLEGEFGEELRALAGAGRAERREAVTDLRRTGMSTRAIGSALGVNEKTVRNDLATAEKSAVAEITGVNGKTYAPTQPERPVPAAEPMPARQDVADQIVAGIDQHAAAPAVEPERPRPPAWDPEEREAHEAGVLRRQDIEAAHQQAKTLVPDVTSHILTVLAGYRLGEKNLVTRDMIAELRRAVDLLAKEIDGEG